MKVVTDWRVYAAFAAAAALAWASGLAYVPMLLFGVAAVAAYLVAHAARARGPTRGSTGRATTDGTARAARSRSSRGRWSRGTGA